MTTDARLKAIPQLRTVRDDTTATITATHTDGRTVSIAYNNTTGALSVTATDELLLSSINYRGAELLRRIAT
ncbi:Uncharacterised protein [Mycobacteroides abscessus subsp. abscessus]|uniref:hypothetical protein n=1 Tax=Mycobacteroides abscessus TaxID=36809 RepID=UPI000927063A|nr:hypothetical protein [Mycobacteroides abscessus]SIH21852.1 Uncharacterised protein [Mycobacteroides abscessus subsp. abscessus]